MFRLTNKDQIRERVRWIRENQGKEEQKEKSKAICESILSLDLFCADNVKTKKIALYFTHKGEVDLRLLKEYFIQNEGRCFYPITHPDEIIMGEYDPGCDEKDQCRTGRMGILEPDNPKSGYGEGSHEWTGKEKHFEKMDWVFLPGIAYDISGNRIGYGKGYYDRYLAQYDPDERPYLIAPAYEFQITEDFFHDAHDIPADLVITEKRVIYIK